MSFADSYEKEIPVNELDVDLRVQRPLNLNKINKMVREYNPSALGVITVSDRGLGELIIIDGQSRTEATRRYTGGTGTVPCRVFQGLTLEEEALLFRLLNTTTKPRAVDALLVRITEGEKMALHIAQALNSYGWEISTHGKDGAVSAVVALQRIYDLSQKVEADPDLVTLAILVVTRAWGKDRDGVQANILLGLAYLIAEHGSRVDVDRLIERLKETTPGTLQDQAQRDARAHNMRPFMCIADLVTDLYNKHLRSGSPNELPRWRKR